MASMSSKKATSLVLVSVLLTSCAQLLFRHAMRNSHLLESLSQDGLIGPLFSMSGSELVMLSLGIALYMVSMIAWIFALSRFDVSLAYPLMSTSYILVYVGAVTLPAFDESASIPKMLGIGIILIGVAVISVGEKRAREDDLTERGSQ